MVCREGSEREAQTSAWAVKCAVSALGRIGPQARDAIPALRKRFDSGADYRMDAARALFLIEPGMSAESVPFLKDVVAGQRKATGSNEPMGGRFFDAIELLGQMGAAAEDAIPVLEDQLQGGARTRAAWSLWRIDPMLLEPMTEIITKALDHESPSEDRFPHQACRRLASP